MTSAFLQAELASLISDSKRKQTDIRSAAEKSLSDLKAISVTSETQLAADLLRKAQFIDPFVLACNSKQTKLAISGTVCLQRLVASKAIPRGRLGDVLDAFHEASNQGYEVQLKILQALPSLLQLYVSELHGNPLAKLLSICGGLAASKTVVVSSTAGATFQQLVASVFERVFDEQSGAENHESATEIAASDASKVFADMCMIVKSEKPQFLQLQDLSLGLALEVIENCLSGDHSRILELTDCMSVCETHLIPGIAIILERNNSYALFGQGLRISYLLSSGYLESFSGSMFAVFDIISEWLDRGVPGTWKRILCLEFLRDLCSDFETLRCLFTNFDRKEDQVPVIQNMMGTLVRIAAEDPGLIGLGRQSTIPTNGGDNNSETSTTMEISDFDALGSVMQANSNVTGLSTKWSTTNTPYLEQTDRKQPPEIPETYVYTLVLACVAAFSDGLSKFIMPLSVPSRQAARTATAEDFGDQVETSARRNSIRGQKYQRLQNPLKRNDLSNAMDVKHAAMMVESCWPAVLAICSTFLNSALDSYFYHILVRTVQKLAQVSGVLDLLTPRDALLTTLAKVSIPLNVSSLISVLYGSKHASRVQNENDTGDDDESVKSVIHSTPKPSLDISRQSLNVRNLLCLRALLNLGIALGPTLSDTSWFIIVQTLQQVEALMSVSPTAKSAQGPLNSHPTTIDGDSQTSLSSEIAAVGTASKRMLESTRTYTDAAFDTFVLAVFKLVGDLLPQPTSTPSSADQDPNKRPQLTPRNTAQQTGGRSMTGSVSVLAVLYVEAEFTLTTVNELSRVNLHRFVSRRSKAHSWDLIVTRLLHLSSLRDIEPALRLQSASIIDLIAIETMRSLEKQGLKSVDLDYLQQTCLQPLTQQMNMLHKGRSIQQDIVVTEIEMHRRLLDALEDIVSHSGESLRQGWRIVFEILLHTVDKEIDLEDGPGTNGKQVSTKEIMLRTLPPSFRTIQLVVADFLRSIDSESLWALVQLLPLFAMQQYDLNISLTTTTLFWTINGLILERLQKIDIPNNLENDRQSEETAHRAVDSSLWFATITHLADLCGDSRNEVRNGAIRVFLRIFEASSEALTSEMWNMSLQKAAIPPLFSYTTKVAQQTSYYASFSQLLTGITDLIVAYSERIITASNFPETWKEIVSACSAMLDQRSAEGHISVFTNARSLVRALGSLKRGQDVYLHQFLELWLHHHPADLPMADESSSTEFAMHAELLKGIVDCNSAALESFASDRNSLRDLVKSAIKKTLLSVVPNRYSDDTKKMTPEQEAVVTNLGILAHIMSDSKHEYSEFIQELIREILVTHSKVANDDVILSPSKKRPQPKYIAFLHRSIELLEAFIPQKSSNVQWLSDIAAHSTLDVLTSVILTKYGNIPVNEASPAWQKASDVAADLLQAVDMRTDALQAADIEAIAPAISRLAAAILNAPLLETKTPPPSEAVIEAGESFDMACFARFHVAAVSLLQRLGPSKTEEKCNYSIAIFRASLIAKPWFGDLPTDLIHMSLDKFKVIRPGSVRAPDFYIRKRISYKALDALLGLITEPDRTSSSSLSQSEKDHEAWLALAKTAAPYVTLRIVHTIKTFIADQTLRNLNPPPRPIQQELNIILSKALQLSCLDKAFVDILPQSDLYHDGKTHLRILYSFLLQLWNFWEHLPRIEVFAWQDDEDGAGIQSSLERLNEIISKPWDLVPR